MTDSAPDCGASRFTMIMPVLRPSSTSYLVGPTEESFVSPGPPADDVSLLALAATVLRYRWVIALCAVLAAVAAAGVTMARPRTYSSTATFLPQARRLPSGVAGLAAQFGIDPSTAEGGQTPQFYVDLLTSRDALETLVDARYTSGASVARDPQRGTTLVNLLAADGATPPLRRESAITTLRGLLEVSSSPKTNVVTFTVRMLDPELAQKVATEGLAYVNRFNIETRQSQARAEREFTERRRDESATKLRDAENRLRDFELGNRAFNGAPALLLERARLQREVDAQQRLYSAFVDSYERARLDEIRDTPVITVVSAPEVPVRPDGRGLIGRTAFGLVGGAVLGLLIAVGRETWRGRGRPERVAPAVSAGGATRPLPGSGPETRGAEALQPSRTTA